MKSHAEGDADRFFDLAMQLSVSEEQKGHTRLAEQLRHWAEAGQRVTSTRKPARALVGKQLGILAQFLTASYPARGLIEVILPARIEEELSRVIAETRRRQKLEEKGLKPCQRILLFGPPGTGKTMSASALAGELQLPLYSVALHGLITKHVCETAHRLETIFDAVKVRRGVYLFDEVDALAADRTGLNDVGEARRVLSSFLQLLDGDTGPSIIVATTNIPGIFDCAFLRRFDIVLPYELPDAGAIREAIERRLIGFTLSVLDWKQVTDRAGGLSTADVVAAAEDAARRAVLSNNVKIEAPDLIGALGRRRSIYTACSN